MFGELSDRCMMGFPVHLHANMNYLQLQEITNKSL